MSPRPRTALPLTALLEGLPSSEPALPASPAPPASAALLDSPAPVVSLIGAGGKTTLLFALARALAASGLKVITATTTHIFPPTPAHSPRCLRAPALQDIEKALQKHEHVTVTGPAVITKNQQRKLSGLSFEDIAALRSVADMVLVEADGAAMRPLKAPASHEPAVPPCTTLCLALCGLAGLGLPLQDAVQRPERAAALCGCPTTATVTPTHLAHLVLHGQGLFRTTPPSAARAVLCTLPAMPEGLAMGTPEGMTACIPAATGQALARQARAAAQELYPGHPARWWVGSALEGWVVEL